MSSSETKEKAKPVPISGQLKRRKLAKKTNRLVHMIKTQVSPSPAREEVIDTIHLSLAELFKQLREEEINGLS